MCHTAAAAARGTLHSTYKETHGSVGVKMRSRLVSGDRLRNLENSTFLILSPLLDVFRQ